jgi:hypothetical protein
MDAGEERGGRHEATKARGGHEDSSCILRLCSSHVPGFVPLCAFGSTLKIPRADLFRQPLPSVAG